MVHTTRPARPARQMPTLTPAELKLREAARDHHQAELRLREVRVSAALEGTIGLGDAIALARDLAAGDHCCVVGNNLVRSLARVLEAHRYAVLVYEDYRWEATTRVWRLEEGRLNEPAVLLTYHTNPRCRDYPSIKWEEKSQPRTFIGPLTAWEAELLDQQSPS